MGGYTESIAACFENGATECGAQHQEPCEGGLAAETESAPAEMAAALGGAGGLDTAHIQKGKGLCEPHRDHRPQSLFLGQVVGRPHTQSLLVRRVQSGVA